MLISRNIHNSGAPRALEKLDCVYALAGFSTADALRALEQVLDQQGRLPEAVTNFGKTIRLRRLIKKAESGRVPYFHLKTDCLTLSFAVVANYEHILLTVEETLVGAAGDWEVWANVLTRERGFVQAWVVDKEYSYWQNATDPKEYLSAGRDYSHLPMRKSESPPPWDRMLIDVSGNPARRIIRMGYVEAVGATMWLGEPFWHLVGAQRKRDICATDWADIQFLDGGVIRVQVAPACFKDYNYKELQVMLRQTLFGENTP